MPSKVRARPGSTPVLICGGGPVGLSAAVELGLRGIHCVVVEPRREPTRTRPRAKTLNVRTMEHLRRWGLADRLRDRAPLPTWWSQDVAFCTQLLGYEINRFTGVLGLTDVGVSPELGQQLPQYVLEDLLREVVSELPTCTFLLGSTVTGLHNHSDRVEVQVQNPDGAIQLFTADYVLGADGARGVVREAIGARYEGTQALRPNLGVVFCSRELAGKLPHPPAVQSWLLNNDTPGLMGPVDLSGTWWLIAFGVDGAAGVDLPRLVQGAIGGPVDIEIVSTDPWTARMELVDRCRPGRIFLIGDAAHLNPPFGGHGLNTGIGDAVDVAWKLAACLEGWGGEALLTSYERERRPLHQRVIEEAAINMATLSTELLRGDLDDPGPAGTRARLAAAHQISLTKRVEYFSLDLVLGHRYLESPVIPGDSDGEHPNEDWTVTARPGRRLPHLWVSPGVSTLDLIGPGLTMLVIGETSPDQMSLDVEQLGPPIALVHIANAELSARLGAKVLIVRPDQIVAWRGQSVPDDLPAVLNVISGHSGDPHRPMRSSTSAR